jgi:acyl carrier protein
VDVRTRIRTHIVDELGWTGPPEELTDQLPLLERRVLDSMGIFELVTFLEDAFGVQIDDADLLPEHFETIDAVARLVEGKAGAAAG